MTLMRFDPFREPIPVSEASKPRQVVLGSAARSSDAPNVVAGSVPAKAAAAAEPAPA